MAAETNEQDGVGFCSAHQEPCETCYGFLKRQLHQAQEKYERWRDMVGQRDIELSRIKIDVDAKDKELFALRIWKAGSEKLDRESRELIGRLQSELAEARREYDELVAEGQGED